MWQRVFYVACGLDEIESIIIVFFNAGGDSKNIRIKNNIFRWHTHLFG